MKLFVIALSLTLGTIEANVPPRCQLQNTVQMAIAEQCNCDPVCGGQHLCIATYCDWDTLYQVCCRTWTEGPYCTTDAPCGGGPYPQINKQPQRFVPQLTPDSLSALFHLRAMTEPISYQKLRICKRNGRSI